MHQISGLFLYQLSGRIPDVSKKANFRPYTRLGLIGENESGRYGTYYVVYTYVFLRITKYEFVKSEKCIFLQN